MTNRSSTSHTSSYLSIPADERQRYVYRIISVERFFELFTAKQNVLVRPKKWEDPFENFILNWGTGRDAKEQFVRPAVYGQCWTVGRASDAMWRIYSPTSHSIRIRSTISKILETLARASGAAERAFVGKVEYPQEDALLERANAALRVFRSGKAPMHSFARTLLLKRSMFTHEDEVRLLLLAPEAERKSDDLYRYKLDPHELVDQVMLDPRISKEYADALKYGIERQTSFEGEIRHSLIYAPPDKRIRETPDGLEWKKVGRRART